jgi:hypothetical protein
MNLELFKMPSKGFRWRDRKGNFYVPAQMETRHLFMTLVMIWNHTMPEDAVIVCSGAWQHHRYNLGPFYEQDYLCIAICTIANELLGRINMEDSWRVTLYKINAYLLNKHKVCLLPFPQPKEGSEWFNPDTNETHVYKNNRWEKVI